MISHDRLKSLLDYDPTTGIFTWRVRRGRMLPGQRAGAPVGRHYWQIMIDGKQYSTHRLAWLYENGSWPDGIIDHKNYYEGDKIGNLRQATYAQNRYNSPPKVGHSKWKGVTYDKGRHKCWKMSFKFPDGTVYQKRYENEKEAAEDYMFLALEHHGEFARFE